MATGKPIRNMMIDYSSSSRTSSTSYRYRENLGSSSIRIFARCCPRILLLVLAILVGTLASVNGDYDHDQQKNFYIVYMGDSPRVKNTAAITNSHLNVLSNVFESAVAAKDSIVHSYMNNFNAFAARLSADEAAKLASTSGVISVFPNRYHKLHTTNSWDFIGFPQTIKRNLKVESNIIVGLLDTGITPTSESFTDKGFGPPPAKWKGSCGPSFANFSGCNNKLIGAQYFKLDGYEDPGDVLSPIDLEGHGTHTSSTLAGNPVKGASVYGIGAGTARGAVPSARIAMYKVCWVSAGCSDMDLLAAFDPAIHDGVDVISISIGGGSESYLTDSIAIGSFHAMKKGIITVASGGNQGPSFTTVTNHAPWILTVAASGTNRQFRSKVMLGNGKTFSGLGVNTFAPKQKLYPLISGAEAGNASMGMSRYCMDGSLNPAQVKGKLVHCILQGWGADSVVKMSGGIGTILEGEDSPDTAQIFITPGTMINGHDGQTVAKYIRSTKSPSAVIYKTQEVNVTAPFVASFSSRGPSVGSRNILKPDITAPGIDILASYTPLKSLTGQEGDTQFSKFTIMSGTSMSCPHAAGVAAYIKSFHPGWSPAAIKSAILTTATPMSSKVNHEAELAYGAGQLNPSQVVHPGLIYDMDQLSYIQFLCHEGYKDNLGVIVGSKSVNCSTLPPGRGSDALNYPTMQLTMNSSSKPMTAVFRRRVTNVGPPVSLYNVTINAPKGVEITVRPMSLSFSRKSQKRSFTVVVKATQNPKHPQLVLSGSIVWKSSIHTVRSPIVIYTP